LTIAFVSGKGGVGKTMLAVAAGTKLSATNPTLLVDLDFFNRGLTGLMRRGTYVCDIKKPAFLATNSNIDPWQIVQVAPNLFHIAYPDLTPEELRSLEVVGFSELQNSLRAFIAQAAEASGCTSVVLDCHGGPDHSSFAACLVCEYSILVSEPDKITFYGTLHFVRQLAHVGGGADYDLRLVFNKVLPSFSALFLRSFYNRELRKIFKNRPLLAVFPLEVYLTKEFERTPLLVQAYPMSLLARKMEVLLADLLNSERRNILHASVQHLPRSIKWVRRWTLGRPNPLFNFNVILITTAVVLLIATQLNSRQQYLPGSEQMTADVLRLEMVESADPQIPAKLETLDELLKSDWQDKQGFRNAINALPSEQGYRFSLSYVLVDRAALSAKLSKIGMGQFYPYSGGDIDSSADLLERRRLILEIAAQTPPPPQYNAVFQRARTRLQHFTFLQLLLLPVYEILAWNTHVAGWCFSWLMIAIVVFVSRAADRNFTYNIRLHSRLKAVVWYIVWLVAWVFPALAIHDLRVGHWDTGYQGFAVFAFGTIVVFVAVALSTVFRSYRDLRFDRRFWESLFRISAIVAMVLVVFVGHNSILGSF
jgi:MinD-like ATPase involved in chromosome partitioning or flagellar assembly